MKFSRYLRGVLVFFCLLFSTGEIATAEDRPGDAILKVRQRSLAILFHASQSQNSFVRAAAARSAGESGDPALISLVKKAGEDSYPTTRQFALQAMLKLSMTEARQLAEKLLDDHDAWVKASALEIYGQLVGKGAIAVARRHLKSPDKPVQLSALVVLVKLGESERLDEIIKILKTNDPVERYQAIGYLGKIGTEAVFPHLAGTLDHIEDETIFYGLKALNKQVKPDLFPKLEKLSHHENPSVRYQTALVMGHLHYNIARKRVTEMCRDTDAMVRLSAAVAMESLASTECRDEFYKALRDPDFGIRSTAARVLGTLPMRQRAELLSLALGDENIRVRTSAVRAVVMMGGAQAFTLLQKMLADSNEAIRAYAAGGILRLTR